MTASEAPVQLDPNIKFDWQETTPATAAPKTCRAGAYVGNSQYTCMPVGDDLAASLGAAAELTADISLLLAESANGEFLQIADGEFSSISAGIFGLTAQLRGELDCKTLQFMARTEGGIWGIGDPSWGLIELGTFEAELEGMLDPDTGVLTGNWSITGSVPFVCTGPWSAMFSQ